MADGSVKIQVDLDTKALAQQIAGLGAAGGVLHGIGKAFGEIVSVGSEFEATMSRVEAVSGATTDEMSKLNQMALDYGESTVFSASEVGSAMEELLKAGLSVEQVLGEGLPGTLSLAAAGGLDLADAASIASVALNSFRGEGLEMSDAANILAGAANASAADVQGLGSGLSYAAATASSVGLSFKDTATALALFSQNGIDASSAGTTLRRMLLDLQPTSKTAMGAFHELGLITEDGANKFFTAEGKLKSFAEVSQILQDALSGLTQQEKTARLEEMFGTLGISAGSIMSTAGADAVNDMSEAIDKISAEEVATTKLDNLKGDIEAFSGAAETLKLNIYDGINPALRSITDAGTGVVNKLNEIWGPGGLFTTAGEAAAQLSTDMAALQEGMTAADTVSDAITQYGQLKSELESLTSVGASVSDVADKTAKLNQVRQWIIDNSGGIVTAEGEIAGALDGQIDALASYTEAQKAAYDMELMRRYADGVAEYARIQRDNADAQRQLGEIVGGEMSSALDQYVQLQDILTQIVSLQADAEFAGIEVDQTQIDALLAQADAINAAFGVDTGLQYTGMVAHLALQVDDLGGATKGYSDTISDLNTRLAENGTYAKELEGVFQATADRGLKPFEEIAKQTGFTVTQMSDALQEQIDGAKPAEVTQPVTVTPDGEVAPPENGESLRKEVADQVQAAVQGSGGAPVKPEVSVEPEVTVEEPATGESAADVARESVEEDAKEAVEPVPVEIMLTATVTMDSTATDSAKTAGEELSKAVAAGAKADNADLTSAGIAIGAQIANGISGSKDDVAAAAKSIIPAPLSIEVAGFGVIGMRMVTQASTGIGSASSQILTALQTAVDASKGVSVSGFDTIGKQMCAGVAQGIRDGTSSITAAIREAAARARAEFQSAMDIHSPSQVMAEDGYNVVAGVAEGIVKGIPLAEIAMNKLAEVIQAASSSNADVLRNRRMTEMQTEIAEMSRILDEYQAMLDDKQKQKEIKDAQAAIKNAKNKKERLKAQEAYNDLMRKYEMERLKDQQEFLEAELAAYEANVQTLVDAYDFLGDRVIEALTTRYEQERDLQLERIDAEYEAATKAADALYELRKSASDQYLKQLEAERDAEVAALQARIDELNAESKAERDAAREAADAAKLAELRANVEQSKNAKFLAEAEAALQAELEKQAQEARERERQAEIESLRQQITDAKDNYTEQKELEQIRMEEVEAAYKAQTEMIKANYDQQKSYYEKFYKELLSAENLNAQARYYLLQESNDEMIALLEEYNPEWYNAGRSFGELFVEALGVEMENVNALIEQAASFAQNRLDWIRAQISEMNSVGSSSGSDNILGSASQSALDQLLSSGAGAATPKTVMLTQEFSFEFNQPIQSPSEVAAAVRAAGQEAAYAIP